MDAATLLKLFILSSVCLIVLSIGMQTRPGTAIEFLKDPLPVSKALIAMFVAMPLFTLLVTQALPLERPVRVALLALSLSPMVPLLPRKEVKLGATYDYAIGLQAAASVASLVAAPLFILLFSRVFGWEISFDPMPMLVVLLLTVGVPLVAGVLVNRFAPDLAARLSGPIGKAATVTLALGALILIALSWRYVLAAVGNGTLLAIALMTLFGLAVGHVLGGPAEGNRHALAVATASRHPGVAIALAGLVGLEPMQPVLGAILLYMLAGAVFSMPYTRWAKARS
jgi:BASS family bile acid:Na+ symporter